MLKLSSSAFKAGETIPARYTGEGDDVSPPLTWSGAPKGTQEFALICDDPDAPRRVWVHWVLYKIPASASSLAESSNGVGIKGKNSFENAGYGGPMPPPGHGVHHYHFKIYALDTRLTLAPGATKAELLKAINGHIIAQTELVGTFERKKAKQ